MYMYTYIYIYIYVLPECAQSNDGGLGPERAMPQQDSAGPPRPGDLAVVC